MPRNPEAIRCAVPECNAWSRRDGPLCATHARAPTISALDDALAVLEHLQLPTPKASDVPIIELRLLSQARRVFTAWVRDTRATGGRPISAAQFLRAWSHSAQIMLRLALLAETEGHTPYDRILDVLEQEIPLLRRLANKETPK